MEGSILPLFMGADGSGPYAVTGPPGAGPLPVQLAAALGPIPVQIAGPTPLPVSLPAGPQAVTLPAAAATYIASLFGGFTPSGANTIALQLKGSATKKISILRVSAYMAATAAALIPVSLVKCSAAAVGGVGIAGSMFNFDSSSPAPTAVSTTFAGGLASTSVIIGQYGAAQTAAVAPPQQPPQYLYTSPVNGQAITLNTANEYLLVSIGNVGAGNQNLLQVEWSEQ